MSYSLKMTFLLLCAMQSIQSIKNSVDSDIFQPNHIHHDNVDTISIPKIKSRRLSDFVVVSKTEKPQLVLPKLHPTRKMDNSHNTEMTPADKLSQFNFDLQVCQASTYKMVC